MKPSVQIASRVAWWFLAMAAAFTQTVPVSERPGQIVARLASAGIDKITRPDQMRFELCDDTNSSFRAITNIYQQSVLTQVARMPERQLTKAIPMNQPEPDESVVDRTHRFIKDKFWDALTRRIDADHLDQVLHDPKTSSKYDYIYVPAEDKTALKYFQGLEKPSRDRHRSPELKVVALPAADKITGEFIRDLDGEHGLLSLQLELDARGKPVRGTPYIVPGGRFNELYCWDSYFIILGLLQDGRTELARGMAENLLYEVRYYGKIPNANRIYYLTRSQPPFLTSIIRAVYDSGIVNRKWLESALTTALTEYQNVWLGRDRLVKIGDHKLSRYFDSGNGPCPETEPGHYDEKLEPWLVQVKRQSPDLPLTPFRFLNEYLYCRKYVDLKADGLTLDSFFKHDRALRESGHDTTHRFDDRTADFVSVDLNALLYKYETDFAELLEKEFAGSLPGLGNKFSTSAFWWEQAAARREAMLVFMWDEKSGFFFDYDFIKQKRSNYISATGLYPLWAKMFDAKNSEDIKRIDRTVAYTRDKLEQFAGLAASAKESVKSAGRHDGRQWDYPYGWAPHQMLVWQGFKNYGLEADSQRLAYRWLYTIAKNAHDFNGMITEKYNVVTGSHDVFVEYGNVGTKFAYVADEGFGWMNASFEVGLSFLSPPRRADLRALKPPP
jgi:alpha,alpha-trehalase